MTQQKDTRRWVLFLGLFLTIGVGPAPAAADTRDKLVVRVIHGQAERGTFPKEVEDLEAHLKKLKFGKAHLLATDLISLSHGQTSRLKLPNKWWIEIAHQGTKDGGIKLRIAIPRAEFATRAILESDATLAVGGPAYQAGALLVAVAHAKQSSKSH